MFFVLLPSLSQSRKLSCKQLIRPKRARNFFLSNNKNKSCLQNQGGAINTRYVKGDQTVGGGMCTFLNRCRQIIIITSISSKTNPGFIILCRESQSIYRQANSIFSPHMRVSSNILSRNDFWQEFSTHQRTSSQLRQETSKQQLGGSPHSFYRKSLHIPCQDYNAQLGVWVCSFWASCCAWIGACRAERLDLI